MRRDGLMVVPMYCLASLLPVESAPAVTYPGKCPFYMPTSFSGDGVLSNVEVPPQGSINPTFYTEEQRACIFTVARQNIGTLATPGDLPGLIRLVFHDATAGGANGSLMKQKSEQALQPNLSGYEIVDVFKNMAEKACKLNMSYADTLAVISAASSHAMGGSDFLDRLQLGRADVTFSDAPQLVPSHNWLTLPMCERWRQVGLSIKDVVAISGSHTVGQAHCTTIYNRFQMMNSTWMDPDTWDMILDVCEPVFNGSISIEPAPIAGGGLPIGPQVDLDQVTPNVFDNGYFKGLVEGKGILSSDQALYSDETIPETKYWVEQFADDNDAFLKAYEDAFLKMSVVGVTTAPQAAGKYAAVSGQAGCMSCCADSSFIYKFVVSS